LFNQGEEKGRREIDISEWNYELQLKIQWKKEGAINKKPATETGLIKKLNLNSEESDV